MARVVPLALALTLALAACGDDSGAGPTPFPDDAFAFSASSVLAVGEERLLVAVSDPSGARLASPEIPVTISVWREGEEDLAQVHAGAFLWALEGVSGLYRTTVQFNAPGIWLVRVTPVGAEPLEPFPVSVVSDHPVPAIGEPAPASDTPTASEFPLDEISTDPSPDPRFYESSIADAVTSGQPSVIVFATPAFCQTAVCGPTLNIVKPIADEYPDVTFVHVEVFTNLQDPDNLELVPAVLEWGLPTEPWVFVVDGDGVVVARFEGVVAPEEITAALERS